MDNSSPTLTFQAGTDNSFTVNLSNDAGNMANVTGKLYFTLKKSVDDPDTAAVLQKTLNFTTDANGNTTLSLTHADLSIPIGNYWYDYTVIISGAVTKSFPGRCAIGQPVTQAVS